MAFTSTIVLLPLSLLLTIITATTTTTNHHHHHHHRHPRHLLHQPFFPQTSAIPPTQPPALSPRPHLQSQQPKYPFSSTPNTPQRPFFPSFPSPPPPPPSISSLATFPANISSILFPHPPNSSPSRRHLIITISISLSLFLAAILAALAAFFLYFRRHQFTSSTTASQKTSRTDSLRLYPPNTIPSDGSNPPKPPKLPHRPGVPNTSSEFLYLGTLINSRAGLVEDIHQKRATGSSNAGLKIGGGVSTSSLSKDSPYQKLGSPELKPLPPLPKHDYTPSYRSGEVLIASFKDEEEAADLDTEGEEEEEDEEFFSPRGSSGRKETHQGSPLRLDSSSQREFRGENFGSRSFNSRTASCPYSNSCSPTNSVSSNLSSSSPQSAKSNNKSPETIITFPAPVLSVNRRSPLPSASLSSSSSSPSSSTSGKHSPEQNNKPSPTRFETVTKHLGPVKLPPPPPPPLPPRFWEIPVAPEANLGSSGPPVLVAPPRTVWVQSVMPVSGNEQLQSNASIERREETPKPKLKPLHWDKVRTSSDRAMVWDQIKSSSFQLNEEMIETLFMVNNSNLNARDNSGRRQSIPFLNQENRVLDPKKSQNIAILLRALNATTDEVCEALLEANVDALGTDLLESLLKMAPTKEEERKLREFKDESPFKLGPAEKFLKAVLDIPFAFKRVDAMLYVTNFDSEVEYFKRSFETLEVACEELRNSRMFLKLLEAVLKTGNRMNVGTNRGDAHAFKLDTLLKLVDVKGTDGKTTLLHFVVQEIIRSEGSRLSTTNQNQTAEKAQQSSFQDDVEFRKLGLQVVSGLSGELTNVKKAAAMDSDALGNEVTKFATEITKVREVVKLNEGISLKESHWKFTESMNGFLKRAEEEIVKIQAQEKVALSLVKEITEYFHGNSAKEEAHPFRIFLVVRDFLSILDHVCKEVGKINERTMYSSVRPVPVNPTLPSVFPGLSGRQVYGFSDDESSPPS